MISPPDRSCHHQAHQGSRRPQPAPRLPRPLPLAYQRQKGECPVRQTVPQKARRKAWHHRKDKTEEQAIALLERMVAMSEADRDALPGSAVKHVKLAIAIMRKRRRQKARWQTAEPS